MVELLMKVLLVKIEWVGGLIYHVNTGPVSESRKSLSFRTLLDVVVPHYMIKLPMCSMVI